MLTLTLTLTLMPMMAAPEKFTSYCFRIGGAPL